MANLTLKVSKPAYEAKVARLQELYNRLGQDVSDYEKAKSEMTRFISGKDDNYEQLCANIDVNIRDLRLRQEKTDAAIRMLQETLKQMEDLESNIKNTMQSSIETAKNVIGTAIDIESLII